MIKKSPLVIALALVFLYLPLHSQDWTKNLPQQKIEAGEELTFYEIQKAFNDYWEPRKVENGYFLENGIKRKASGWKQFKRWEWFWENRVDPVTGAFPKTSAAEIRQQIRKSSDFRNSDGNWLSRGPTTTTGGYAGLGRLNCVGFVPGDADRLYVGSPSGGVWKTTDGGTTWEVLTDENDVLGVSDILVYPSPSPSSDTVYIATGDRDKGSLGSLGGGQFHDNNTVGVLKSVDGGTTWSATGLAWLPSDKKTVNRLLKHPASSDSIYAACTDGVFLTTDAGVSWDTIEGGKEFIDMEFKPLDPGIMYGSAKVGLVFKSSDKGETWALKLVAPAAGRVELAVSEDEPDWVYALVSEPDGSLDGIYKSEDEGETWTKVFDGIPTGGNLLGYYCDASGDSTAGQGFYDLCIAADPFDASKVYIGGVNTWKSMDGGMTWFISNMWTASGAYNFCGAPVAHADKHSLDFLPGTSILFEGNDGGLYKSSDDGTSWSHLGNGLVISQVYRLGVSQTSATSVIAGLQDNGTKSNVAGSWKDVIGGDGMACFIDYTDEDVQYGELQYGVPFRTKDGWSTSTAISPPASPGAIHWVAPFVIDPITPETIYIAYDTVWKSTDQGDTWTKLTGFDTGGSSLKSMAIAPSSSDTIYVAKSSKFWASYDGGTTWAEKTAGLPVGSSKITYISVKHDDGATVWVAFGEYNAFCVYESTDGGSSWTDISSGLPSIPVMCVVQNKQFTDSVELYAGTDVGVYVKVGSADWALFSEGLPNVVVTDLDIYYDTAAPNLSRIRAGTYGRGIWDSELYSPLGSPPVADFEADNTTPLADSTVRFTDLSINDPDTWDWTFTPGTVTYLGGTSSSSQHPEVSFDAAGDYTVRLIASNLFLTDTMTKTAYISVISPFVWKGSTSADWSSTANWEDGAVPDSADDVVIPSGATFYPELTAGNLIVNKSGGSYNCKSLTIKSGGTVTVGSSGVPFVDLLVYGDVKVESGGTLEVADFITLEDGGMLYITGGTVTNTVNTASGFGGFYTKFGSGGSMTAGSLTVNKYIWLTGGSWSASGGTVHCGGSASTVNIINFDFDTFLHDFVIDEDVTAFIDTVSVATLSVKGDYTQLPGSKFTVSAGETLDIEGGAILNADATGASSLLNEGTFTVDGSLSVEQYIADDMFHMIASPVGGETAMSLYFGGDPQAWLAKYLEPSNDWEFITSLSTPLTQGTGFMYWLEDGKGPREDKTISFDGPLTSADMTITALDYSGDVDHGYNVVGNPFPCALDWDTGSWDTTDINGSIWVWKDGGLGDGSGSYLYRNAQGLGSLTDGIIPMGQAFFIQTSGASPSLTIPADARVHSSTDLYKKGSNPDDESPPYVVLEVDSDGKNDEVWISFLEGNTDGFDNGSDVHKLFSTETIPEIYLEEGIHKLSIDALPVLKDEPQVVSLNLVPDRSGEYTMELKALYEIDNAKIILEDLFTGDMHDLLADNTYTFFANDNDEPQRFLVHFNPITTGIDDLSNDVFSIYSNEKNIYIKTAEHSDNATVYISDVMGRQIVNDTHLTSNLTRIPVHVSYSYLIVRIIDGEKVVTKKIFVR